MFDLDAMATFVAVVRAGHFAAAATALRLPKSTVSQRVARLESTLGVRLLERTTRSLRPTSPGAAYYERCARILAEVEDAAAAVKDLGTSPRGVVRVATPLLLGQAVVAAAAAKLTRTHPEVEIEVVALDRRVRLIEEGFDLALAVNTVEPDSTMISRVLLRGERWCCAAPGYLSARDLPAVPRDVRAHDCIVIDPEATGARHTRGDRWSFARGDRVEHVEVRGRLRLNSMIMARAAALAGAGIAAIPSFLCTDDVARGRLVRVLPDWSLDRRAIRVIYPSNRHLSQRVRLVVDALAEELARGDAAPAWSAARRRR